MRYVVLRSNMNLGSWIVVDRDRTFNRVVGSYATREQAAKRRRDMERKHGTTQPKTMNTDADISAAFHEVTGTVDQ